MADYLGKQLFNVVVNITPAHGGVLQLTRKVEGACHELVMDNYFSSPPVF
jgi:hypothetical protein